MKKYIILFAIIGLSLVALAGNEQPDQLNRSRIKPTLVNLEPGQQQQFYAVRESARLAAAYATSKAQWSVNGIPGGNEQVGTVTGAGLYTAPLSAPGNPEIHIQAILSTGSNKILWATVLINGQQPTFRMVKSWGELKDTALHLVDPQAIALEADGNVLIADKKIKRFSSDGQFLNEIGGIAREASGRLEDPLNVAVDRDGKIFVSDKRTGPPRIIAFTPNGEHSHGFAPKGVAPHRVMDTRGMAVNSRQQVIVGDIDNMRVSVFENNGVFVRTIGKKGAYPGELNVPYGLATDPNDELFVVSYFGPCQKFTSDGYFLEGFCFPDPPDGPVYLTDVACNSYGDVYILVRGAQSTDGTYGTVKDAEGERYEIIKYNNNGDLICHIALDEEGREARRLTVDDYDRIWVLYESETHFGVEVLEQAADYVAAEIKYRTVSQWSESIESPTYFNEPHCIKPDGSGNLLVADMNNARVMRFSKAGEYLEDIGNGPGSEDGYFTKPRDVNISPEGNIVVTDQKEGKNRVQVFDRTGKYMYSFAPEGHGEGEIDWPHGLAFDSGGNTYVTDVAHKRVNKYDPEGIFLLDIGSDGPNAEVLTTPHGLTITPNDAVFVSDYHGVIQKFSPEGKYILSFRNVVHTEGTAFVHTIASDSRGFVYLMVRGIKGFKGTYEEAPKEDCSFYIAKYTNDGEHLETITLTDPGREVIHCAVDEDGVIYTVFKGNGRMGIEILKK